MTQRELDKVRFEVDILTYVLTDDVSQRARVFIAHTYLHTRARDTASRPANCAIQT